MDITRHQVFYDKNTLGSSAALVLLDDANDSALDDDSLQRIALKLKQPATAFIKRSAISFVGQSKREDQQKKVLQIPIRWFNSSSEIQRCGHASFAVASYLIQQLNIHQQLVFMSSCNERIEVISAFKNLNNIFLKLDYITTQVSGDVEKYQAAFNYQIINSWQGASADSYCVLQFTNDIELKNLAVDISKLQAIETRAVIALQLDQSGQLHFRYFAPHYGVNEDQATGSAMCVIAALLKTQIDVLVRSNRMQGDYAQSLIKTLKKNVSNQELLTIIQDSESGAVMQFCCLESELLLTGNYALIKSDGSLK